MSSLKVSEVFCYICRGVLIEPVTLPCCHVFCLTCFEQSMQETSHSCPFCRKRISNWIRNVKKSNTLVNKQLWEKIQQQFKEEVRLKLNGEDDGLDHYMEKENPIFVRNSKPGEVAQEFSQFLKQFKYENERMKAKEELASKKLIEKIRKEEEENLKLLQKANLLRIKEDERLALLMQERFNKENLAAEAGSPTDSVVEVFSQETSKPESATPGKSVIEERVTVIGPMDSFVKGLTDSDKIKTKKNSLTMEETDVEAHSGRSTSTDSTDSLRLEMNLFKPIKKALTTPPKRYPDGRIKEINLTKVVPVKLTFSDSTSSDGILTEGKNIHSNNSAFVDTNSYLHSEEHFESPSKRLKLSLDTTALKNVGKENNETSQNDVTEGAAKKRTDQSRTAFPIPYHILGHDLKNAEYADPNSVVQEKIVEEQRRIEQVILQEKTDRELALKLSQEWESEERRKPLTRSMLDKNNRNSKRHQLSLMEAFSRKRSTKK